MSGKTDKISSKAAFRGFFSRLLVWSIRVLLFPLTALYTVLVFLWSLPFRLYDMVRRARHPFLCATAPERMLDEHDPSVRLWDLYCAFRYRALSRTDSLFNAYYIYLCERTHQNGRVARAPRGVPKHPFGWYSKNVAPRPRRFSAAMLAVVTFLPRLLGFLPFGVGRHFKRFGRAMENSQTAIGGAARFLRRRGAVLFSCVLCLAVGAVIGIYSSMEFTLTVHVGDETIGCVESRAELADAIRETENTVSDALGTSFKLPVNISYSLSKQFRPAYLSKTELLEALSAYTTDYVRVGYALYVDGELIGASENEGKLRELLAEALKNARKKSANEEIDLLSETRILYQNCPVEAFLSDAEFEKLLLPKKASESGAEMQLAAYQPFTLPTLKTLSAGQAYCYSIYYNGEKEEKSSAPSLVYGLTRVEEVVSPLPFNVTYRESDTIYEGSQYVHQKGVAGEKLVTYTVYYSGDKIHSKEVLSEATMTEPIDQIVLIGTKPLPTFGSETGEVGDQKIFISPVYGEISSHFGLRDMNNDGVLESGHSGVDIPATDGTPLYAAASGVVLEAGDSETTYGIAVKILHENGLVTYYAHLSAVTVKAGQTVTQNQMIGNVGTTGFVTGPHVHFEVRLPSGVQVNPVTYMIGY